MDSSLTIGVGLKEYFFRFFKNKYVLGALSLISLALLILWLFPGVYAADYTNSQGIRDHFTNFIEGAQKSSIEHMAQTYSSFSNVFDPDNARAVSFKGITLVQSIIAVLAGGAISIFFAVNIIKEAQKGDLTADYWQRIILNLVISLVVTLMASRIMSAIYNAGDLVITGFSDGFANTSLGGENTISTLADKKEDFATLLSHIPGMEHLPSIVSSSTDKVDYGKMQDMKGMLVFMEYLVWFPLVISVFLMFSSIFEIKIRELFAPVATASILVEGSRGSGARFLKKYAACFLKIAIYFAIAYLGIAITNYFYSEALNDVKLEGLSLNLVFMLMANVVAGMAMMQTGGLADEIVGV